MTTDRSIPLARPDINQSDIDAVVAVLKTSQLSLGAKLGEFEKAFAVYVGVKHAIAVSSGTAALHLMIRALGIDEGDEVITTPFSFVASANCALFERARTVFADILPETFCIDPAKVEAAITPKTKAIVAVDILGYLCDWDALRTIATKHRLALIEDSCEALGATRDGRQAGTFGDCGVFGFYPNKQMTTGEGGMITTDRDDLAALARSMRNQGRDDENAFLRHDRLGYNYRLSDINCALGISQLARINSFLQKRAAVAAQYAEALQPLSAFLLPAPLQQRVRQSWFVYVAHLDIRFGATDRDRLIAHLKGHGIGCSTYFPALHLQPLYRNLYRHKEGDFPLTEAISERTVALPFHNNISVQEIAVVVEALKEYFNN